MLILDKKDSKTIIRLMLENKTPKAIGYILHHQYIKHLRPYVHQMQKTDEIGFNAEVVNTIPFEEAIVHVGHSSYYISKETILNESRLDHYGKFEEQYFVHKCHLTEVTA